MQKQFVKTSTNSSSKVPPTAVAAGGGAGPSAAAASAKKQSAVVPSSSAAAAVAAGGGGGGRRRSRSQVPATTTTNSSSVGSGGGGGGGGSASASRRSSKTDYHQSTRRRSPPSSVTDDSSSSLLLSVSVGGRTAGGSAAGAIEQRERESGGGGGGGGGSATSHQHHPHPPDSYEKSRNMASSNHRGIQIGSAWFQRKINLRPQHRGVHLVTEEILRQMPELGQFSVGLCHVQILHTSASLALNESWDPDVRDDMEMMLNKIVPEGLPYRHSCEGPDDMPAHVKACFLGSSLTIPITDGKLSLGTWQGVWLCEHRDHAGSRKLVITLSGCPRDSARSPLSPVSPIASTSS